MANTENTSAAAGRRPPEKSSKNRAILKWALLALPLGYLWFRLINDLRLEWETNPQYSYGLVVPLLVVGLLMRRWLHAAGRQRGSVAANPWLLVGMCGGLALLYLPTRLIEAATPEWRPIQWLLGFETIGLTLYAVYLAGGKSWLRQAAFPVAFFLVSIPWPTLIEAPIVQGLSRINASMVVEVLGVLNVPAIQHGNLIEVSTGVVGINDACSGIRSFQSSLMIGLFLGEFYMFSRGRRWLLVPVGFAIAMILNLGRASLLTWMAAKKGMSAIADYHDQAGLTILLACTAILWGVAWLMNWRRAPVGATNISSSEACQPIADDGAQVWQRIKRFGLILIVWLVLVESGVEFWYHVRESRVKPGPLWSASFPTNNPTFKELPLTKEEHELLRFDQGWKGQWQETDGAGWQAFYFNWLPGRVAGYLAKRHTPDICITASGLKLIYGPELMVLNVKGVELPMRHYVFESSSGPLQVFQCHWEAGMGRDTFTAEESSRFNLIRGVWAGRGNQGQKGFEVILTGYDDPQKARQALAGKLDDLIKVEN